MGSSKEEFDNYEKEKSKSVKPEQTLGEKFMNMFRGDKKEKSSQLLSVRRVLTLIFSDDSIKVKIKVYCNHLKVVVNHKQLNYRTSARR